MDAVATHRDGQRLGLQSRPGALGAWHLAQVVLQVVAQEVRVGLGVAALEPADDPLIGRVERTLTPVAVAVLEVDLVSPGAVQHQGLIVLGQVLPRGVHREPAQVGHRPLHPFEILTAGTGPGRQRPLRQRLGHVGNDQLGVDLVLGPEPSARRAGTVGRVEREVAGRRVLEADAAVRTSQVLAEGDGFLFGAVGIDDHDLGHALGQRQRRLQGLGQPAPDVVSTDQPVDHHLDGVVLIAGQLQVATIGQFDGDTVDPDPGESLLGQIVQQCAVLALASPHHRRQHQEPGALGHGQNTVHDLLGALAGHRTAAHRAVGLTDAGIQEAQVVVDLSDGADRGARIAGC